jgi:hypothetical protein
MVLFLSSGKTDIKSDTNTFFLLNLKFFSPIMGTTNHFLVATTIGWSFTTYSFGLLPFVSAPFARVVAVLVFQEGFPSCLKRQLSDRSLKNAVASLI